MRKIIVEIDDSGRTEVTFDVPDDHQGFVTRRDLDRVVKAIKLKYRQLIKEFRRKKIIKELEINKDGKVNSRNDGRIEKESEQKRGESGQEAPGKEERSGSVDGVGAAKPIPRDPGQSLARAVAAKAERIRRDAAGAGS